MSLQDFERLLQVRRETGLTAIALARRYSDAMGNPETSTVTFGAHLDRNYVNAGSTPRYLRDSVDDVLQRIRRRVDDKKLAKP